MFLYGQFNVTNFDTGVVIDGLSILQFYIKLLIYIDMTVQSESD